VKGEQGGERKGIHGQRGEKEWITRKKAEKRKRRPKGGGGGGGQKHRQVRKNSAKKGRGASINQKARASNCTQGHLEIKGLD